MGILMLGEAGWREDRNSVLCLQLFCKFKIISKEKAKIIRKGGREGGKKEERKEEGRKEGRKSAEFGCNIKKE